jgi:hypothetical protein
MLGSQQSHKTQFKPQTAEDEAEAVKSDFAITRQGNRVLPKPRLFAVPAS